MRGLLIKDIRLIMRQKNMLLMMVLILFLLSRNGLEVTLSFFILLSFALGNSTVGYDGADRGMSYLMTLPVNRSIYVIEKYVVTMLPAVFATGIAIAIRFVEAKLLGETSSSLELAFGCLAIFFLLSLVMALFLPMELLGKEKAQLLMNIGAAAVGIAFYVLMKNETAMERIRAYAMNAVENIHGASLGLGALGIWLAVMVSSVLCSLLIMKRKQF